MAMGTSDTMGISDTSFYTAKYVQFMMCLSAQNSGVKFPARDYSMFSKVTFLSKNVYFVCHAFVINLLPVHRCCF